MAAPSVFRNFEVGFDKYNFYGYREALKIDFDSLF